MEPVFGYPSSYNLEGIYIIQQHLLSLVEIRNLKVVA